MTISPKFGITYLEGSQAQKHISANEGFRRVEALTQIVVIDRNLTTPPGSPANLDTYIPAATATGDWTGAENDIAFYDLDEWVIVPPAEGMIAYIDDENQWVYWNGTSWADLPFSSAAFSGARVRLSSAQTIPVNTNTAFVWGTEDYDTDAYHANVTETATDISFTASDTISSAGSNFGSFSAGDVIRVQGTTGGTNDGTYTIATASASTITTDQTTISTQSAGPSVTVTTGAHLLIPSDGYYRVTLGWTCATFSTVDSFQTWIDKNAAGFSGIAMRYQSTVAVSGGKGEIIVAEDFFSTGDYLEGFVFHTVGSSLSFNANEATFFAIQKIGS